MKRACATCGAPLPERVGRGRPSVYCSPACSRAAASRQPYVKGNNRRPCSQCGRRLPTSAASSATPRCHTCRSAARTEMYGPDPIAQRRGDNRDRQRQRRANGTAISPGNHRARALRFGVEYEYVDRRRVFNRDRWRCGICRHRVDKRLKYPHPRSASLDHIVPMSKGGGHTYLNTQCGHLDCNLRKLAAGEGEQLALIG